MRSILVFAAAFGLLANLADAQTLRYDTIRYARDHYQKRIAHFKTEPTTKGRIIFLGDSHLEYGNWKKLLSDSTVVNRGIAADNTFGVLDRLDEVIRQEPEKLFVEIGINDIAQEIPVDIIAKNIATIASRVRLGSPLTEIYVTSILPSNDNCKKEYPEVFGKNTEVDKLNAQLKRNASGNKFVYVDFNNLLSAKDGKLLAKYARTDGLHLNDEGYRLWVDLLKAKKYL